MHFCILMVYFLTRLLGSCKYFLVSFQHLHILQDMLKDYALGEHLLLVGNQVGLQYVLRAALTALLQRGAAERGVYVSTSVLTPYAQGVGKNKIADRFLQLLNLPREYLQLHR